MNLRILKKLSKRAAPYLPVLGDTREQFRSERGDNYHGLIIRDRTDAERWPSCHTDQCERVMLITEPHCRRGSERPYVKLMSPYHPRKATLMVGAMCGYYEPEWEEETAFGALQTQVFGHFTDWKAYASDDEGPWITRDLSSISKLFAAADEMVAERRRSA